MYYYRTPKHQDGITRISIEAMKNHLAKVGKVLSIRLYAVKTKRGDFTNETPRVMVTGENGKARLGGFLWGYMGEGPRGLVNLLTEAFGCPKVIAEKLTTEQPSDYFNTYGKRIRTIALLRP